MMQSELKRFRVLQYQWIRLQHPSKQVAVNKRHPLHHIELEISHTDHIVHNLIQDVLSRKGVFNRDDVTKLITTFSNIRVQLDSFEDAPVVNEYKDYVDRTLELLNSALALVK